MTNEKYELTIEYLKEIQDDYIEGEGYERHPLPEWYALDDAIKALEQQPCEDECITKAEVINTIHKTMYGFFDIADDDSEEPINDKDKLLLTINKAISNAVKALPSVTPQPFINKPCVSEGVCREDKIKVLDKIRAEIEQLPTKTMTNWNGCCPDFDNPEIEYVDKNILLSIIDKYKSESEDKE